MVADENLREASALGREIVEREDAIQVVKDAQTAELMGAAPKPGAAPAAGGASWPPGLKPATLGGARPITSLPDSAQHQGGPDRDTLVNTAKVRIRMSHTHIDVPYYKGAITSDLLQPHVLQDLTQAANLPPGPKKALNAFMFFASEKRAEIKAENPAMAAGIISKLLGEMWNGLSPTDRIPYLAKAANDKERYQAALVEYQAVHGALPPAKTTSAAEVEQVQQ